MKQLESKKFVLALLCFLATCLALVTSKISGDNFVTLIGLILGLYGVANVYQKKVQKDEETYL